MRKPFAGGGRFSAWTAARLRASCRMPPSRPSVLDEADWRPVAFKEWQLVAEAVAAGEQTVLLRKGGIAEGKHGFQWLHDRFFLFPSWFHEQAGQVRPDAGGQPRRLAPPAPGDSQSGQPSADATLIPFSVYVETLGRGRLTDWDEVASLAPWHIWTEEIVRERYAWGDEPGIAYAVVRAWTLPRPWRLADRAGFGGCRSWIGLPSEEGGGWRAALEEAREVAPACGLPEFLFARSDFA